MCSTRRALGQGIGVPDMIDERDLRDAAAMAWTHDEEEAIKRSSSCYFDGNRCIYVSLTPSRLHFFRFSGLDVVLA